MGDPFTRFVADGLAAAHVEPKNFHGRTLPMPEKGSVEARVLAWLCTHGDRTGIQIAEGLDIDPALLYSVMQRLQRHKRVAVVRMHRNRNVWRVWSDRAEST